MEKINVAELLKDCPKGMELDCTMFEGVYFDHVDESRLNRIKCYVNNGDEHFEIEFEEYGQYISNDSAKCVIYPKGKTTWEGFVPPYKFKDGDVVYTVMDSIAILGDRIGEHSEGFHSYCGLYNYEFDTDVVVLPERFATEEEKQILFNAIKANGYRWNEKTKTLEKLHKFKVGDKIRHKTHIRQGNVVTEIKDTHYILDDELALPFISQDEYELVPDKFDINTLVPFESRVLVRDSNKKWRPAVYGFCNKFETRCAFYAVGGCVFEQCIPYEGNQHLLGTNNDCNEHFKTWE